MISLERCRKVLGPRNAVSDQKLAMLREQLYCLAEFVLDIRDKAQRVESVNHTFEQVANSEEDQNVLRERAAIIEFESNISRDEAERMAISLSLATEQVN
jgi:hypothetical protein